MESSRDTPFQDERFLLLEAIGRGGMGSVYRAFDRSEQRLVAIKVPSTTGRPGPAHPLSTEFDVWTRLSHPNIVRVYGMGLARLGPIAADTPYLVLEHVPGKPVHRAYRPGRMAPATIHSIAEQVLRALDHLHARGFVHRDIKPGNVLVHRANGGVPSFKLTDFGLAKPIGSACKIGMFSGSLPYISPEALLGLPIDGRSDLYALGILLYYLSTGRMPMPNLAPGEILRWHLVGSPADPSVFCPAMPDRLARFIHRLTARDRACRPETAEAALRALGARRSATPAPRTGFVPDPAARAELRLALDAVRLGASRVWRVPDTVHAQELTREVAVWAQVRGMKFHELHDDPSQLVLSLVQERGESPAELVHSFSLDRSLSLGLLGNTPLLDRDRDDDSVHHGRLPVRDAARAIGRFLLSCASLRPMVLRVECSNRSGALVRALTRQLVDAADDRAGPSAGRGGLLLLLRESSSVAVGAHQVSDGSVLCQ